MKNINRLEDCLETWNEGYLREGRFPQMPGEASPHKSYLKSKPLEHGLTQWFFLILTCLNMLVLLIHLNK